VLALLALSAAAAAVALAVAVASAVRSPIRARAASSCPALVAHRGYAYPYSTQPENSLGAFAAAFRAGAKVVKADVQFSAPSPGNPGGDAVIIHDTTVNRMTTWRGAVDRYQVGTLIRMRLLEKPGVDSSVTSQHIPTLDQALTAIKADRGRVMLEIHADPLTAPQAHLIASELVKVGGWSTSPGWVSFNSFWPASLAAIRAAVAATGHTVVTQLLTWSYTPNAAGNRLEDVAYAQAPASVKAGPPLTAAEVAAMHAAKVKAGAFTPDSRAEWSRLASWEVDQITTDDAGGYVAWCKARA
jgi:glycerophosphoryl diester phosphodiesterase